MNFKYFIIAIIIAIILIFIYEGRYYILWFISELRVTLKNKKSIKDIQKKGMNSRNINNENLLKFIETSKKYLDRLGIDIGRKFILKEDLERHLRYSRFSEKYILELLNEILSYMNLDSESVVLKVNYISSKNFISYAGLYYEEENLENKKQIVINVKNGMTMDTIISTLAHECTHHLLLSNKIKLDNKMQNEILTDVTTVLLGFGKYMLEGYKISNRVIYDEINHRSIDKDRVGYLSYKDVEATIKLYKKLYS